jgi:hypothetical protein
VDHERFHPGKRYDTRERIRKEWEIPAAAPVLLTGDLEKGVVADPDDKPGHRLLAVAESDA